MYCSAMIVLCIYIGVGLGLAIAGLYAPNFVRGIDQLGARTGLSAGYGRAVWFGGTLFAWPIGLYVLITGRLVFADADRWAGTDGGSEKAETDKAPVPRTGEWIAGDRSGP